MIVLVVALWIVSLGLLLVTLLPLVRSPRWWVRVWDYPRLQVASALALALVGQLLLLGREGPEIALMLATAAGLAWQIWRIWPYTRLHRRQVLPAKASDPSRSIRLLVANVLQDNRRADLLLRRVEEADPDLVLAVETNGWWDERLAVLREDRPFAVCHPLENTYGMHLFSRLELSDIRVQDRVSQDIPSFFARVRLRSGTLVNLHCVHPEPPQPGNDVAERDAELMLVAREAEKDGRPTIVCGDLNDVAWSHTTRMFQRISGLLDPRIGRGLYPTFHAEHRLARWPLDHVFHDASFRLVRLEVLDYFGSDHFAILVELLHDPAAVALHEIPEADAEDRTEAAEKIAEGREAAAEAS
ncbi:endonuclease/exonuclease/phosphatase family protein [Geminicoccus roseus]|uniref:endonuclease/exonuclease/phosphatase family protein n=1 Tax=Geminicoccus roseus TaxID=404900 RepID=UPI00041B185B|nr:endonuclease/exonuclease/phosphatase family protein [Geminicoccus roseus]